MPNLDSILLAVNGCGDRGYGGIAFLDSGIELPPDYHLTALPAGVYFNEVIAWPSSTSSNDTREKIALEIFNETQFLKNRE